MNRNFKFLAFGLLILAQLFLQRYKRGFFNIDFLFLILVYISVKSGFLKSVFSATAIGLITDYLSGNILGVFGFSRTVSAYLLNEISMRIDLKSNFFVFLLISSSLALSNLIANVFFHYISQYPIDLNLILYQPLLTGMVGLLIVIPSRVRQNLDVY